MFARKAGRIVVNTSVSGLRNPNAGLSLYSASKAATISLMRSAAMEAAPRGVGINAIAPGRVVTDMMLHSGIADMSSVAAGLPLRRMGKPEEVARRWFGCFPTPPPTWWATCWPRMAAFWLPS